jgi:ABC-type molybdate transport system substrate-binding protein
MFHKAYPRMTVTLDFGSSTTLTNQLIAGAPADVYASADLTGMDSSVLAGTCGRHRQSRRPVRVQLAGVVPIVPEVTAEAFRSWTYNLAATWSPR